MTLNRKDAHYSGIAACSYQPFVRADWQFVGLAQRPRMEIQATTEVHCPICANTPAKEVLVKYSVTAKAASQTELGGLAAFMCSYGRVFFVRRLDANFAEGPKAAPLAGPESKG